MTGEGRAGEAVRILVLCTGNSARSQIAEALLATRSAGRVRAWSAGSHPAPAVHPYAVAVLANNGIEWSGKVPKSISDVERMEFDLVITVCDNAREACPILPGAHAFVHWGLPDPAGAEHHAASTQAFRMAFDALSGRIDALLRLPMEQLAPAALAKAAADIHQEATGREYR